MEGSALTSNGENATKSTSKAEAKIGDLYCMGDPKEWAKIKFKLKKINFWEELAVFFGVLDFEMV